MKTSHKSDELTNLKKKRGGSTNRVPMAAKYNWSSDFYEQNFWEKDVIE